MSNFVVPTQHCPKRLNLPSKNAGPPKIQFQKSECIYILKYSFISIGDSITLFVKMSLWLYVGMSYSQKDVRDIKKGLLETYESILTQNLSIENPKGKVQLL